MVEDLLTEIRAWLGQPGNSKAELARLTGLHRNTLLSCDREDWNPTLEIVRKVESVVYPAAEEVAQAPQANAA